MTLAMYDRSGRILSGAVVAFLMSACTGDTPGTLTVAQDVVASPAGADSGEPFLAVGGEHVYMSWLEASPVGGHDLRLARFDGTTWNEPTTIAHSESFFVNWADFPSISVGPDGALWAHWLERGAAGGYDYGVRVVRSADDGASWSEPLTPHDDASPTEHGFVSTAPVEGGMGFAWLDGRQYVEGPDGSPATGEMTLRHRVLDAEGMSGPETLVDARVCDCCQTSSALTERGAVVVYRDRSPDEIRDIYISRRLDDGSWTEGRPVHDDGWEISGCPVNGPAVVAGDSDVAVAWFTAAGEVPRVKVAFSRDAGDTFLDPVTVDDGNPGGRVDLVMADDGSVLVSWLERTQGEEAEIRLRRVERDGSKTSSVTLSTASAARASGFPRMVQAADGTVFVAWTDVGRNASKVSVSKIRLEGQDET